MSFSYSDYDDDDLDLAYLSPEEEVFDLSAVMPDMDRLMAVDKPIPVTSPRFRQLPSALRSPTRPPLGTTEEVGSVPEAPRPGTPVDSSGVPLTTPLGLSTPQPRLRRPSPTRTDPVPVAVGLTSTPVRVHDGGGDRSDLPDAVLRKSSSLNLRAFISPRPANTTVAELRARAQVVLDRLAVKRKESLEFFAKLAAGDQDPDELGEIFLSPSRGITSLPATAIPSHQDLHTPIRPRRSPLATENLVSAANRPDPDRLEATGPAAGSSDDPVVTSPSQISPDFTRLMDTADLGAVSPPSATSHPVGDSSAVPTGRSLLVLLSEARSAPRPFSPAAPANTVPRGLPSAPSIARHHPFRPQPRLVGRIFTLLDGWSRIDRRTVLLQRREPSSQVLPVNDLLAPDQTIMERCTTIVISPDEPGRLVDPAVRSLLADSVPEFYRVLQSPRRHRRVPRAPRSDDRSAPRPASPPPPTRLRRPSTRTRYFQPVKLSKPALSFTVTPSDLDPAALDPRDIEALADRSLCGLNVRYLINGYLHAKRDWREPSPLPLDPAPSQARPPGTNTNRHLPPRGHASLLKPRRWLSPTIEPSLQAQPLLCSPVPPTSPLSLESGTFPCSSQDGQWIHPNELPTPYQLPTVDRSQTSLASSSFGGTLGPTSPRFSATAEPLSPAGTHLPGSTKHTSGDGTKIGTLSPHGLPTPTTLSTHPSPSLGPPAKSLAGTALRRPARPSGGTPIAKSLTTGSRLPSATLRRTRPLSLTAADAAGSATTSSFATPSRIGPPAGAGATRLRPPSSLGAVLLGSPMSGHLASPSIGRRLSSPPVAVRCPRPASALPAPRLRSPVEPLSTPVPLPPRPPSGLRGPVLRSPSMLPLPSPRQSVSPTLLSTPASTRLPRSRSARPLSLLVPPTTARPPPHELGSIRPVSALALRSTAHHVSIGQRLASCTWPTSTVSTDQQGANSTLSNLDRFLKGPVSPRLPVAARHATDGSPRTHTLPRATALKTPSHCNFRSPGMPLPTEVGTISSPPTAMVTAGGQFATYPRASQPPLSPPSYGSLGVPDTVRTPGSSSSLSPTRIHLATAQSPQSSFEQFYAQYRARQVEG